MNRIDTATGRTALCVAHCAGLIDLVAPPLWVAALMQHYLLDPQQAGLLLTLFLGGGALASVLVAPQFHRLKTGRWLATIAFGLAALAFHTVAQTSDFARMAVLHAAGGLAVGSALSVTHGTVARSSNPHRLFGLCTAAQSLFGLAFMATMPSVLAHWGAHVLFELFAVVMGIGAVAALVAFPAVPSSHAVSPAAPHVGALPQRGVPRVLWGGIAGLCCMGLVQAMTFAFLERVGADRGFGADKVAAVLAAVGLLSLVPSPLAVFLERRLPARAVLLAGPLVQAAAVTSIFTATQFPPYAVAGVLLVSILLFVYVFGFGLLARLDTSGRAMAGTPAMMMTGAAIGPVLSGSLVKAWGYPAVAVAACVIACLAMVAFSRLPRPPAAVMGQP